MPADVPKTEAQPQTATETGEDAGTQANEQQPLLPEPEVRGSVQEACEQQLLEMKGSGRELPEAVAIAKPTVVKPVGPHGRFAPSARFFSSKANSNPELVLFDPRAQRAGPPPPENTYDEPANLPLLTAASAERPPSRRKPLGGVGMLSHINLAEAKLRPVSRPTNGTAAHPSAPPPAHPHAAPAAHPHAAHAAHPHAAHGAHAHEPQHAARVAHCKSPDVPTWKRSESSASRGKTGTSHSASATASKDSHVAAAAASNAGLTHGHKQNVTMNGEEQRGVEHRSPEQKQKHIDGSTASNSSSPNASPQHSDRSLKKASQRAFETWSAKPLEATNADGAHAKRAEPGDGGHPGRNKEKTKD